MTYCIEYEATAVVIELGVRSEELGIMVSVLPTNGIPWLTATVQESNSCTILLIYKTNPFKSSAKPIPSFLIPNASLLTGFPPGYRQTQHALSTFSKESDKQHAEN